PRDQAEVFTRGLAFERVEAVDPACHRIEGALVEAGSSGLTFLKHGFGDALRVPGEQEVSQLAGTHLRSTHILVGRKEAARRWTRPRWTVLGRQGGLGMSCNGHPHHDRDHERSHASSTSIARSGWADGSRDATARGRGSPTFATFCYTTLGAVPGRLL